jgi:hypothetical protein
MFGMELFLNLCWLSLLLPAYLLWLQRTSSSGPTRSPVASPLVFICVLGCALVLLFPVISASDDLHAMRPEMEESERAFRHASQCASTAHALTHFSQPVLPSSAAVIADFLQTGTILSFLPQIHGVFSTPASVGRAPPFECSTAL